MVVYVRDEYSPLFGRQRLTLWSGRFCQEYEGNALELPDHNGYMIETPGRKVRVECESPRTEKNYVHIDQAINAALEISHANI